LRRWRSSEHYHKGLLDRAIDEYTTALSINPNYAQARDNLQRVTRHRRP
jgi:hypothetical protein